MRFLNRSGMSIHAIVVSTTLGFLGACTACDSRASDVAPVSKGVGKTGKSGAHETSAEMRRPRISSTEPSLSTRLVARREFHKTVVYPGQAARITTGTTAVGGVEYTLAMEYPTQQVSVDGTLADCPYSEEKVITELYDDGSTDIRVEPLAGPRSVQVDKDGNDLLASHEGGGTVAGTMYRLYKEGTCRSLSLDPSVSSTEEIAASQVLDWYSPEALVKTLQGRADASPNGFKIVRDSEERLLSLETVGGGGETSLLIDEWRVDAAGAYPASLLVVSGKAGKTTQMLTFK